MGLFKTEEEKEKIKEEKKNEKFNKFVEKYNLKDMDIEDYELLKNISDKLIGTNLMEIGANLSFGTSTTDQIKINRLGVIQEQNWIIINQLSMFN